PTHRRTTADPPHPENLPGVAAQDPEIISADYVEPITIGIAPGARFACRARAIRGTAAAAVAAVSQGICRSPRRAHDRRHARTQRRPSAPRPDRRPAALRGAAAHDADAAQDAEYPHRVSHERAR